MDAPVPSATDEELPIAALLNYLSPHILGLKSITRVYRFAGGYSNLTYGLDTNLGAFVLRRPPPGANIRSAHDMGREFRVLSLLAPHYSKSPRPILLCEDSALIGAPFFLMEKVEGQILRHASPGTELPGPETMAALSDAFVQNLAELHALPLDHSALAELGKPEGYVQRQVSGWLERYRQAETSEVPAINVLMDFLPSALPATQAISLVHNDYKYDNLVLDPADLTHIKALLDWEMCTIGDSLMDVGTSLAYWFEAPELNGLVKGFANLTWLPGNKTRKEIWDAYCRLRRLDPKDALFYYVFGCFKVAVIIQQIFARFTRGGNPDPRFAHLDQLVAIFGTRGAKALQSGRISCT